MATYGVTFVQNHVYWVEANNESEAKHKAYEKFKNNMTNCIYDEVIVDEVIENEEE